MDIGYYLYNPAVFYQVLFVIRKYPDIAIDLGTGCR